LAGTKQKKKSKKAVVDLGPEEIEGYQRGQKIWCQLYSNGAHAYGRIEKFYTSDSEGNAASIYDEINCGYRMVLVSTFSENPPPGAKRKLTAAKAREAREANTKGKRR